MEFLVVLIIAIGVGGCAVSKPAAADGGRAAQDLQHVYLQQQKELVDAQHELQRLHASMDLAASMPQAYREAVIGRKAYMVTAADKSVLSLIVRWAEQDGKAVVLNGQPIKSLAEYRGKYVDYPVIGSAAVIADSDFVGALRSLAARYAGRTSVPLEINTTDTRVEIVSQH